MQPNRLPPKLPPYALKTFEMKAPLTSHHRVATCAEVECDAYKHGWQSLFDVSTELGLRQYKYVTEHSGRTFTDITTLPPDTRRTLRFPPGQTCFRVHYVPLEREPFYVVRDGDWRGNPRGTPVVRRNADDWVDDFSDHQDRISREIEKG